MRFISRLKYQAISLLIFFSLCPAGTVFTSKVTDSVSTASEVPVNFIGGNDRMDSKILIILASSGKGSTAKLAGAMAAALDAQVKSPETAGGENLQKYSLIGFGSGIFDQKHHAGLLEFAGKLPNTPGKKAFLFSTSGMARKYMKPYSKDDPHTALRNILLLKGYIIEGEFNCAGFNDNSFLKFFGGMNKGKPDSKDLKAAEDFARSLTVDPGMKQ